MNFSEFIQQGKVRKGEKDIQKAKALLKMSERNYKTITAIPSTSESAPTIFSILYESLREIIEAMCLSEGYGVYSHEAFTFYLQEKKEERIAAIFDRYRKLRNGIHYYGKGVSIEVAEEAKIQVKKIIEELK
ncbi:hypothetical protein HYX13_03910, partial [Candidatus Woesearchaeota archaeon]|nr:hypothetical protein [Candidatus Woesearchaeota archaeon]